MRPADDADFTEFVIGSSRRLLGLGFQLTSDADAAEELLQGALEHAYQHWPRLNREGAPEGYVRQAMLNASTDRWHRRGGVVELEPELVVDVAAPPVSLPPDLANRVRRGVRERTRRRLTAAVAALVLVAGGGAIAAADHSSGRAGRNPITPPPSRFRSSLLNVDAMVVSGDTLYVASSAYPRGLITSYNRTTGAQRSSAMVPARPNALAVGADGTVWVSFYPSNAGHRAGVTEFSPDLGRRSTLLTNDRYLDADAFDVSPLGHDRALLATDHGLVTASLPPLGTGPAVAASRDNARIAALPGAGSPTRLAAVAGGDTAVLVTSPGGASQLTLRSGSARFAGADVTLASSPDGLWLTTGTGSGSVVERLDATLSTLPITATSTTLSLPGGVDRVWTSGRTVWVATGSRPIRLACFAFSGPGQQRIATRSLPKGDWVMLSNPVVSGELTVVPTPQTVYVAGPFGITGYAVPAACRSSSSGH